MIILHLGILPDNGLSLLAFELSFPDVMEKEDLIKEIRGEISNLKNPITNMEFAKSAYSIATNISTKRKYYLKGDYSSFLSSLMEKILCFLTYNQITSNRISASWMNELTKNISDHQNICFPEEDLYMSKMYNMDALVSPQKGCGFICYDLTYKNFSKEETNNLILHYICSDNEERMNSNYFFSIFFCNKEFLSFIEDLIRLTYDVLSSKNDLDISKAIDDLLKLKTERTIFQKNHERLRQLLFDFVSLKFVSNGDKTLDYLLKKMAIAQKDNAMGYKQLITSIEKIKVPLKY